MTHRSGSVLANVFANPVTNLFGGIRGRVTFTVLAVSALLFSVVGTIGFVMIADGGRAEIRGRIEEVLDQLENNIRAGAGTQSVSTPDGVAASVGEAGATVRPGEIVVERAIELGGTAVVLVGRSSQARLTDSLRSLYRGLWIAIPLAAIASALMAGFATRRALRPVAAITELAGSIGAERTTARVPVPDTGDEIERLAVTVNEMLDRIDEGRQAHRQFTSDAAHELRTPLMALQGELELIGGHPERVDADALDRLDVLGHRLQQRIDDLVLLSTLDEGRPLVLVDGSLLQLVTDEVATSAPGTEVWGVDVVMSFDRALVGRAVRNLLTNARRHACGRVEASVLVEGERVWLHVDDDGPGIDAPSADAVFQRLARLDEARTTDAGGSGLGLAIVASVAEAHRGGVAAGRGPLGGARVSMWLPVPSGSAPS